MDVVQFEINATIPASCLALPINTQLLLVFGTRSLLLQSDFFEMLRLSCPEACIVGCSTAGEISGTTVHDNSIVLTAIRFQSTQIRMAVGRINTTEDSYQVGATLCQQLVGEGLRHILVFSDGLRINGSELVRGLKKLLPDTVNVTGGLAGDGTDFHETVILANAPAAPAQVVGIGFYGSRLHVGYGSVGGWDPFGPRRLITKSTGNILYELDNESALKLYKTYLGSHAERLPSSGLLFPLALYLPDARESVVRTILGVDEAHQSMTFAGDIPEGHYVQIMKANFNRLVDGAIQAAEVNYAQLQGHSAQLALLISCVGRKLVLQQRIEEETEGVADILGKQAILTGFYSYGEIAPHGALTQCELHNQTMTVTTFAEE